MRKDVGTSSHQVSPQGSAEAGPRPRPASRALKAALGIVAVLLALGASSSILPGIASSSGGEAPPPAENDRHVTAEARQMALLGPSLARWSPPRPAALPARDTSRYSLFAQARYHNSPVYMTTEPKWGRGLVRYGAVVRARWLGTRDGCSGGHWYELASGGYVCSARGFSLNEARPARPRDAKPPQLEAPLPYRYARVVNDGALRFERKLTAEEIATLPANWDARHPPDDVVDKMVGDYFVALAEPEQAEDGTPYHRTVRGHYVRSADLEPLDTPQMLGIELGETNLPVAFVHGAEEVPLFRLVGDGAGPRVERAGVAHKHARTEVERSLALGGTTYWVTDAGLALAEEHVRVVRARERPDQVGTDERWLHVDLAQQALVAYEGDAPVYATLISSGKEGYGTPTGEFRVRHKYVSITMRGEDPVDGVYEVEEVPWTQYYDSNFAVHGAYWHDGFGKVRSHGCTNVAPADARWLYEFTAPRVPADWHGVREEGTHVVITG